jgi:hypothetical protein
MCGIDSLCPSHPPNHHPHYLCGSLRQNWRKWGINLSYCVKIYNELIPNKKWPCLLLRFLSRCACISTGPERGFFLCVWLGWGS